MTRSIIDEQPMRNSGYINPFTVAKDSVTDVPFSFTSQENKDGMSLNVLGLEGEICTELNSQKAYGHKEEEEIRLKTLSFKGKVNFLNDVQKKHPSVKEEHSVREEHSLKGENSLKGKHSEREGYSLKEAHSVRAEHSVREGCSVKEEQPFAQQEPDEKVAFFEDPLPVVISIDRLLNLDELDFSPYYNGVVLYSGPRKAEKTVVTEQAHPDEVKISVDGSAHQNGALLAGSSSHLSADGNSHLSLLGGAWEDSGIWRKALYLLKDIRKIFLESNDRVLPVPSESPVAEDVVTLSGGSQVDKGELFQVEEAFKDVEAEQNWVNNRDVGGSHRILNTDIPETKSLSECIDVSVSILQKHIQEEIISSDDINVLGDKFLEFVGILSDDMKSNLVQLIMEALLQENREITNRMISSEEDASMFLNDKRNILRDKVSIFFGSIKKDFSVIKGNEAAYIEFFGEYIDVPGAQAVVPLISDSDEDQLQAFCDYCICNFERGIENIFSQKNKEGINAEQLDFITKLSSLYYSESVENLCDNRAVSMSVMKILNSDLFYKNVGNNICSRWCKDIFAFITDPTNAEAINFFDSSLITKMKMMDAVLSKSNVNLLQKENGNFRFSHRTILKLHYSGVSCYDVYAAYVLSHINRELLLVPSDCASDLKDDLDGDYSELRKLWNYMSVLRGHMTVVTHGNHSPSFVQRMKCTLFDARERMWIFCSDRTKEELVKKYFQGGPSTGIFFECRETKAEESEMELLIIKKWSEELQKELQNIVSANPADPTGRRALVIASHALNKIDTFQKDQEFFLKKLYSTHERDKVAKKQRKEKAISLYNQFRCLLYFLVKNTAILSSLNKKVCSLSGKILNDSYFNSFVLHGSSICHSQICLPIKLDLLLSNKSVSDLLGEPYTVSDKNHEEFFDELFYMVRFNPDEYWELPSSCLLDTKKIFDGIPKSMLSPLLAGCVKKPLDKLKKGLTSQPPARHYALGPDEEETDLFNPSDRDGLNLLLKKLQLGESLEMHHPVDSILLKFYMNKKVYEEDMYAMFEQFFVTPAGQNIPCKEPSDPCKEDSPFVPFSPKGIAGMSSTNWIIFNNFLNDILSIEFLQLKNRLERPDTHFEPGQKECLSEVFVKLQSLFDQMMKGSEEIIGSNTNSKGESIANDSPTDGEEITETQLSQSEDGIAKTIQQQGHEDLCFNDSVDAISVPPAVSKEHHHMLFHHFINIVKDNQCLLGKSFSTTLKLLDSFFFRMKLRDMLNFLPEFTMNYSSSRFNGVLFSHYSYVMSKKLPYMPLWLKVKKLYSMSQEQKNILSEEYMFLFNNITSEMAKDEDCWKYFYLAWRTSDSDEINGSAKESSLDFLDSVTENIINDYTKKWRESFVDVKKFLRWRKNYIKKVLLGRGDLKKENIQRLMSSMLRPFWAFIKNMQILLAIRFLWDFILMRYIEKLDTAACYDKDFEDLLCSEYNCQFSDEQLSVFSIDEGGGVT